MSIPGPPSWICLEAMSLFSTKNGLWCIDTALMPLEAMRVYVKELHRQSMLKSHDDQCLAYGALVDNKKDRLMQLVMRSSGADEGLKSLHWVAFAHYDEMTSTWTYERERHSADIVSLPQWSVHARTQTQLTQELSDYLRHHPIWLVWPLQPDGVRLDYRLGAKRQDGIPTPLQSSKLPFEAVDAHCNIITPSPPSEGEGESTAGSESLPPNSPRKPSRSVHESDEESCVGNDRSRSPVWGRRRRACHSGSETESCLQFSPSFRDSQAGSALGSPEVNMDDGELIM